MATGYGEKPFGMRALKIKNGATVTLLPVSRRLSFTPQIASAQLEGDDIIAALVSFNEGFELQLEAGGVDLAAWSALTGAAITATGTTPNRVSTMTMKSDDSWPYVEIYGEAIDAGAGATWVHFFKCKVQQISGSLGNKEFFITQCTLRAIPDTATSNKILEVIEQETAAALP